MIAFFCIVSAAMLIMYAIVWAGMATVPVLITHLFYPAPFLCIIMRLEELWTRDRKWDLTEPYWYAAQLLFFAYVQVKLCMQIHGYYETGSLPNMPMYSLGEGFKWIVIGIAAGGVLCWISIKLDNWYERKKWREEREKEKEKQKMEIEARIAAGEENLRSYYQSLCQSAGGSTRPRHV